MPFFKQFVLSFFDYIHFYIFNRYLFQPIQSPHINQRSSKGEILFRKN